MKPRVWLTGIALALLPAGGGRAEVRLEILADGSARLTGSSAARAAPEPRALTLSPDGELLRLVDLHAERQSLDPRLVDAVIRVESGYDVHARSRKGALGLMQLMPATAAELGVADPFDAEQNLRGGTTYLRQLLGLFDGRLDWALAAYNAGPDAVRQHGGIPPYPETDSYVRRVLRLYRGDGRESGGTERRGRPVFLTRSAQGLLLTTTPPAAH